MQYLVNFTGLVGIVNANVYKTEPSFHRSQAQQIVQTSNTVLNMDKIAPHPCHGWIFSFTFIWMQYYLSMPYIEYKQTSVRIGCPWWLIGTFDGYRLYYSSNGKFNHLTERWDISKECQKINGISNPQKKRRRENNFNDPYTTWALLLWYLWSKQTKVWNKGNKPR